MATRTNLCYKRGDDDVTSIARRWLRQHPEAMAAPVVAVRVIEVDTGCAADVDAIDGTCRVTGDDALALALQRRLQAARLFWRVTWRHFAGLLTDDPAPTCEEWDAIAEAMVAAFEEVIQ